MQCINTVDQISMREKKMIFIDKKMLFFIIALCGTSFSALQASEECTLAQAKEDIKRELTAEKPDIASLLRPDECSDDTCKQRKCALLELRALNSEVQLH